MPPCTPMHLLNNPFNHRCASRIQHRRLCAGLLPGNKVGRLPGNKVGLLPGNKAAYAMSDHVTVGHRHLGEDILLLLHMLDRHLPSSCLGLQLLYASCLGLDCCCLQTTNTRISGRCAPDAAHDCRSNLCVWMDTRCLSVSCAYAVHNRGHEVQAHFTEHAG